MSEQALSTQAFCPNCNAVSQFLAYQQRAYITVVFVPLIPLSKRPVQWVCSSCGFAARPEVLTAAQSRHEEQLGVALRASMAYMLRRISPGNGVLALVGDLASGCFGISPEYSAAHAARDLDWFVEHGCTPYIEPARGLLVGDMREDFFGLVAVLGIHLADTQPNPEPHITDLAYIGNTVGLSAIHQQGIIQHIRSIN